LRCAFAAIVLTGLILSPCLVVSRPHNSFDPTPPELWHFDLDSNSYGGAAVGDIDSDGKFEVVFGTYLGDETLYALNAEDGSVAWTYWAGPGPLDASVKLIDINGDQHLEVIFATSGSYDGGSGVLHCLHGNNGSVIWHYDPNTCTDSPPAIVDIDNDSRPEILYGVFNDGINGGYVHIVNAEDGSLAEIVGPFDGYIQSGPAVVDLDLDGQLDFVITMYAGDNRIYAVNGSDYSTMWYYATGDGMYHTCSFSNLDADAFPELVVGNYDGYVYVLHGENGSLFWQYDMTYAAYCTSIGDVDGDSCPEVVAAGTLEVTVINHDGSHLWSEGAYVSFRGAALADVDGDGGLDVVFGDNGGLLQALDGTTGATLWSFDAASEYGVTPFEIDHAPVIADLNGDGDLDIFFVGGRGRSDDPGNNYGRAYALRLSDTTGGGWTMFHHDYCNSGYYGHEVTGEMCGVVTDSVTGAPIEGALVTCGSIDVLTDETGFFVLHVPCGTCLVNVSRAGYEAIEVEATAVAGLIADLEISLESWDTTTIGTVAVTTTITELPINTSLTTALVITGSGVAIVFALHLFLRQKQGEK
jgi:outer membrane protein assembly factor BamB